MTLLMAEDMAKRGEKPKAKPEPEPEEKGRKPMILQIRGSDEFKAWYDELAAHDGLTGTALFDRSIRQYAKLVGFTKPAPQR
jgi:hypothetical protein